MRKHSSRKNKRLPKRTITTEKKDSNNKSVNAEEAFLSMEPNYPTDERYELIKFPEKSYRIPKDRATRIYCDGIFDLFHYGHARLFAQVKQMFPNVELIVGVCNDELTQKYKGSTVMNERERYESIRQCRHVDEVIENAPWVLNLDFLERNSIDYVAHDDAPYSCQDSDDIYAFLKRLDRFIPTKRAAKISTTAIITKIIKNYNVYVRRQLLRGISLKDMNVSFFERGQIKIQNELDEDVKYMKEEFKVAFKYWEDLSERIIRKIKNKLNNDTSLMGKVYKMIKNKSKESVRI